MWRGVRPIIVSIVVELGSEIDQRATALELGGHGSGDVGVIDRRVWVAPEHSATQVCATILGRTELGLAGDVADVDARRRSS